jgi:Glycosyl hydrolase family 26
MRHEIKTTQIRRHAGAKAIGLLLALACCLVMPSTGFAAAPRNPALLYWGAQIGSQLTGSQAPWDMTPVHKFERITGKGLSLVEFSAPFAECEPLPCMLGRFPSTPMENIRQYGAIPVFSWNSSSSPPRLDDPSFQLSDIIDGSYDAYIREFALAARAWGHPFFLRFNWEMNGFWFPWSEGVNGNKPGEYVAAWRHVHNIFTSVGATNATWVWCPNVDTLGELRNLRSLYPGNAYVDWTCLDGFNWGIRRGSLGWVSFSRIYGSTYRQIAKKIAPTKPMVIAEVASSDRGGSKAGWIRDMLLKVRTRYRKIRGLIWYDVNDRNSHWPIETSRTAAGAFRNGIRSRAYTPNIYGNLSASPIHPPAPR